MAVRLVKRHEEKYLLSQQQAFYLRHILDALMQRDAHSSKGPYYIRSLYFDTIFDRDYTDKVLGVSERSKIRLRLYDVNSPIVKLEKKAKTRDCSQKDSIDLDRKDARSLIQGDAESLLLNTSTSAAELYTCFKKEKRIPVVLIDYERTAWMLPLENIRITLDENVRAARSSALFEPDVPMVGLHRPNTVILEVKYDNYYPRHLQNALASAQGQCMSISKYESARRMLY